MTNLSGKDFSHGRVFWRMTIWIFLEMMTLTLWAYSGLNINAKMEQVDAELNYLFF